MFTLIVIGYLLFFFVLFVGIYASQQLVKYQHMWEWLHKQYEILNSNEDYQEEANNVIHKDMPIIERFCQQNMLIITPILLVAQVLNAILIFMTLVMLETPTVLSISIVSFNALSGMCLTLMRRRWYQAEGICHGTKALVESLDYYKDMQKITES